MARTFRTNQIFDYNWSYKTHPKKDWVAMYSARELGLRNRNREKSLLVTSWDDIVPSAVSEPIYNSNKRRKRKIRIIEERKKWAYLQKEKV